VQRDTSLADSTRQNNANAPACRFLGQRRTLSTLYFDAKARRCKVPQRCDGIQWKQQHKNATENLLPVLQISDTLNLIQTIRLDRLATETILWALLFFRSAILLEFFLLCASLPLCDFASKRTQSTR
jgi:hypothetical protein